MSPDLPQPPDLDHQPLDDANFTSGDLAQALGLVGRPKFVVRRVDVLDILSRKRSSRVEPEAYTIEYPLGTVLGEVGWVENGGWAVKDPTGRSVAMLWRQHTEDHSAERLSNLVHLGFHRFERAVKEEANASLYCLANLDKTVRMFVTYRGEEAILDAPSNRPVLKLAKGSGEHDLRLVDAFDDDVAAVHSDRAKEAEVHEVTFTEVEDPFPVALFVMTLGLEMNFRHGEWRSPYAHTEL